MCPAFQGAVPKCYKTIWNEALGAWVAASENDAARGKPSKNKVAVAVALGALAFSGGGAFLSEAHAATPGVAANSECAGRSARSRWCKSTTMKA
ncbi:ESPR domain-containing protein [Burkholderia sp. BCC1985]|uniref:ESPR domain-containing protein n=1 Tax=Burkholderia sp. BCC1985 TaxID=2817442 RepID=UPI0039EF4446